MTNYAIGDIQGCYRELEELLVLINFDTSKDKLWLCGDLVNRGPKSLECLKLILSIKDNCFITLGNHDLHLIAVSHDVVQQNDDDTIDEILLDQDRDLYIKWLKSLPLLHASELETQLGKKKFVMSHAGIPPHWSLSNAIKYSNEIECELASEHRCKAFLEIMYGNDPSEYSDDLTKEQRLRLHTNYLTRMRFCNDAGKLEFNHKGVSKDSPKGYRPWFEHKLKIMEGNVGLLFGHWAALDGETGVEGITALDTGCVWGKKLTAINLEEGRVFSCNRLN